MPLELKNDIEEKNVSINFDRIRTQFNILEKEMQTQLETLSRIEEKIDNANEAREKTSSSITVSRIEFRIYTAILFISIFGFDTIANSKILQGLLGKLF